MGGIDFNAPAPAAPATPNIFTDAPKAVAAPVTATEAAQNVALAQKDNDQTADFWKNQTAQEQTQASATIAVDQQKNTYNIQVYVIIAVVVVLVVIFFTG